MASGVEPLTLPTLQGKVFLGTKSGLLAKKGFFWVCSISGNPFNVGIGTTAPTDTLHVVGDVLATAGVHIGADAANNLIDDASGGTGSTTLYIGNSYINVTASDQRLKENITPSVINALELIKKMDIKDFDWKKGSQWRQRGRATGLIAQEVIKYLPQVVNKPEDPKNTWAVEYHHIVPYLIKAVQEQQVRINALEARVKELGS